jgi:hypothetical protein
MPKFNGHNLDFTETTRNWFWTNHPFTASAAPDGTLVRWWKCTTCQQWVTEDGVQIGHVVEWRKYLTDNGITDATDISTVRAWYNDTRNLAPQCKTCNTSHDWEFRNYQGEVEESADSSDMDTEDTVVVAVDDQGNLDDFVVPDSQCPYCQSENTQQQPDQTWVCDDCEGTWGEVFCPNQECMSSLVEQDELDDDQYSCTECGFTWSMEDMKNWDAPPVRSDQIPADHN